MSHREPNGDERNQPATHAGVERHREPNGDERNRPCFCGSGVKAKKCPVLLAERDKTATLVAEERAWRERARKPCEHCGESFTAPAVDVKAVECPKIEDHLRGVYESDRSQAARLRMAAILAATVGMER